MTLALAYLLGLVSGAVIGGMVASRPRLADRPGAERAPVGKADDVISVEAAARLGEGFPE